MTDHPNHEEEVFVQPFPWETPVSVRVVRFHLTSEVTRSASAEYTGQPPRVAHRLAEDPWLGSLHLVAGRLLVEIREMLRAHPSPVRTIVRTMDHRFNMVYIVVRRLDPRPTPSAEPDHYALTIATGGDVVLRKEETQLEAVLASVGDAAWARTIGDVVARARDASGTGFDVCIGRLALDMDTTFVFVIEASRPAVGRHSDLGPTYDPQVDAFAVVFSVHARLESERFRGSLSKVAAELAQGQLLATLGLTPSAVRESLRRALGHMGRGVSTVVEVQSIGHLTVCLGATQAQEDGDPDENYPLFCVLAIRDANENVEHMDAGRAAKVLDELRSNRRWGHLYLRFLAAIWAAPADIDVCVTCFTDDAGAYVAVLRWLRSMPLQ